jgi:Type VI secretion system, TssN
MDFHFGVVALVLITVHFLFLFAAWRTFRNIPERRYEPWFLPSNQDAVLLPLMQHMRIRLQLRMLRSDRKEKAVTVSIPPRMTLGDLFSNFVLQQRKHNPNGIDFDDPHNQPYAWEFYASKWGGFRIRILDPDKSLIENKLKSYNIVAVKRIHLIHN